MDSHTPLTPSSPTLSFAARPATFLLCFSRSALKALQEEGMVAPCQSAGWDAAAVVGSGNVHQPTNPFYPAQSPALTGRLAPAAGWSGRG